MRIRARPVFNNFTDDIGHLFRIGDSVSANSDQNEHDAKTTPQQESPKGAPGGIRIVLVPGRQA